MRYWYLLSLIVLLFVLSSASVQAAACLEVKTAKASYFPRETVQVEIDSDVSREIKTSDLFLYREGTKIPASFFISRITSSKYFAWFDLPISPGDYSIRVRGVCKEGNIYIAETKIKVKEKVSGLHDSFREKVDGRWSRMNVEQNILAAAVISYDTNLAEDATDIFKERDDSCINSDCDTVLDALSVIAFEDNTVRQETLKNLNEGLVMGNESVCWPDETGKCSARATAYALFALTYAEKISNNTNYSDSLLWLTNNSNLGSEEKALLYYITGDNSTVQWLLNNQNTAGWWAKTGEYKQSIEATSLAILALETYKEAEENPDQGVLNSIEKGETWLKQKLRDKQTSLSQESYALLFAFPAREIEPIVSIWPGIVKTESQGTFNLIIKNQDTTDAKIQTILLNSTKEIELGSGSMKSVEFVMPNVTTLDGRAILDSLNLVYYSDIKIPKGNYIYHDYSIPLIIFTEKSGQEGIGNDTGIIEDDLNQTEEKEIINKTEEEWKNKTTNLEEDILEKFGFIEPMVTKAVYLKDGTFSVTVRLKNELDQKLKDIRIDYDSSLIGLINTIEPSDIATLGSQETETIKITLVPSIAHYYDGNIIAKATYGSERITTKLPLRVNVTGIAVEEKTCAELGGKECGKNEECQVALVSASDTFSCCNPSSACKRKPVPRGRVIGLIIVFIIIGLLILLFYLLRKKPPREMEKFLKEASQQYEKKFQRPSSIRRKI